MNPSILPVIGYTLDSKKRTPIDLKYLAKYTIKPFLSQVEGVSEIRIIGGKEKEYWVLLNPSKMSNLGITPEMVSNVLSETNFVTSNGFLSNYRFLYLAVTNSMVTSAHELENLVIRNSGKRIVTLRDIAEVDIQEAKAFKSKLKRLLHIQVLFSDLLCWW